MLSHKFTLLKPKSKKLAYKLVFDVRNIDNDIKNLYL